VRLAAYLVLAYLIGAIPTAVLVARRTRGIDIRRHGSGNAGATNVWRVLGWKHGLFVMAVDAGKGALAAALVPTIPFGDVPIEPRILAILCGLVAVLGHVFPIFAGFRGGKGVATAAGMLVAVAPVPIGIAVGVFALTICSTGRVSAGSILSAVCVPISVALFNRYGGASYPTLLLALTGALALFILFTHRANVVRLVRGTEPAFRGAQVWRRVLRR